MARVRSVAKRKDATYSMREEPKGMPLGASRLFMPQAYAAAALAPVGTAEIVFRICEAIW